MGPLFLGLAGSNFSTRPDFPWPSSIGISSGHQGVKIEFPARENNFRFKCQEDFRFSGLRKIRPICACSDYDSTEAIAGDHLEPNIDRTSIIHQCVQQEKDLHSDFMWEMSASQWIRTCKHETGARCGLSVPIITPSRCVTLSPRSVNYQLRPLSNTSSVLDW